MIFNGLPPRTHVLAVASSDTSPAKGMAVPCALCPRNKHKRGQYARIATISGHTRHACTAYGWHPFAIQCGGRRKATVVHNDQSAGLSTTILSVSTLLPAFTPDRHFNSLWTG
jgi:hypothetical protein